MREGVDVGVTGVGVFVTVGVSDGVGVWEGVKVAVTRAVGVKIGGNRVTTVGGETSSAGGSQAANRAVSSTRIIPKVNFVFFIMNPVRIC